MTGPKIAWRTLEPTDENMTTVAIREDVRFKGSEMKTVKRVVIDSASRPRRGARWRAIHRDRNGDWWTPGGHGFARRYVKDIRVTLIDGRVSHATVTLFARVDPPKGDRAWRFDPIAQAAKEEAEFQARLVARAAWERRLMAGDV